MRFISDSPRARVLQFRELHEHVGHLVAALAATDVDDDVGIGPLGQLVLHDRLAAAKRAGHGGHAALGHREQRVDDALASDHRLGRRQLFGVRAAAADRPTLQHGQLDGLAILLQPGNRLHDVASPAWIHVSLPETPGGTMTLCSTASVSWTVPSTSPALSSSPTCATGTKSQSFSWSSESTMMPRVMRSPACLRTMSQRTLNAVVNRLDEAGRQFDRQRRAGGHNRLARTDAARFFRKPVWTRDLRATR